jgi:hypothetical protein
MTERARIAVSISNDGRGLEVASSYKEPGRAKLIARHRKREEEWLVIELGHNDLRQLGWMLIDLADRLEDEVNQETAIATPEYSNAFLAGYRDGFTFNAPVYPYPKDSADHTEYVRGYQKGEIDRLPVSELWERADKQQCEYVDPVFGRCTRYWGHAEAVHHYLVAK